MKIQEYFDQIQKNSLSNEQKDAMFENIYKDIKAHENMLFFTKTLKIFAGVSLIAITASAFLPNFSTPSEITLKNGIISSTSIGYSNQALASQVGEFINFQGNILINGEVSNSTKIYQDQTLTISSGSVEVSIGSGTRGKIIGPAKFVVHKIGSGYQLELLTGNYIKIQDPTTNSSLSLKAQDLYITKTDNSKPLEVEVVNQNGSLKVTNQAQNIDIKTSKGQLTLKENNTIQISSISTSTSSSTQSTNSIKTNQDISVDTNHIENSISSSTISQPTQTSSFSNIESGGIIDEIKVEKLQQILYGSFLNKDESQYIESIKNCDENANSIAYQNILQRISRVYVILGIDHTFPVSSSIQENMKNLKVEILLFEKTIKDYEPRLEYVKDFIRTLTLQSTRNYCKMEKPSNSNSSFSQSIENHTENSSTIENSSLDSQNNLGTNSSNKDLNTSQNSSNNISSSAKSQEEQKMNQNSNKDLNKD